MAHRRGAVRPRAAGRPAVRTLSVAVVLAILGLGFVPAPGGHGTAASAPSTSSPGAPPPTAPPAAPRTLTHPVAPGGVADPHGSIASSGTWTPPSGHAPASWRGASGPPGGQLLSRALRGGAGSVGTPLAAAHPAGNISKPYDPHGYCYGVWPSEGGQDTYTNDCYGHDEPGIQFYSTLGGSGGNVTWNVTLPISHDPSNTQSDLYTAIWFGMTLSDPYAWMDQCFLELQFYPDSDWYSTGSVFGSWVGAAVAWQIEAASGYENACFYQVLNLNDGSFNEFRMSDGDQITVAMTGWIGDPYGENLTLTDRTNGEVSVVNLYNAALNYPLDPAYGTSTWPNSLQWTPGGELPVVFAFETGHTVPPYPNTNYYGGCNSGPPPSTPANPSVPCPSYDPASWNNDTIQPWYISAPTFSNATAVETPTQVSFTQDLGGISLIDPLSNYTCYGRDGSAWCSYPWYSYSCGVHAFEFGATDYPGVTADFGSYLEYAQNYVYDAGEFGYVPPTNFSIPTCGGPSYRVSVGTWNGNGSAYFLSTAIPVAQSFSGLGPGEYAVAAIPRPGYAFQAWEPDTSGSGNVSVTSPLDPTTTLWVRGNGSILAQFAPSNGYADTVTFHVAPSTGRIVVVSGDIFPTSPVTGLLDPTPLVLGTFASGGLALLGPGHYSIQAYPPAGYNFTGWSVVGGQAVVAAPLFPFTWLDIPTDLSAVSLTASFSPSVSMATVVYSVYGGGGTVAFDGGLPVASGSSVVKVGTYPVVAVASAGEVFAGWFVSSSAVMIDLGPKTNVTLEDGTTYYLYAEFTAFLRVQVTPAGSARAVLDNRAGAPLADPSSFVWTSAEHSIYVVPSAGYRLSSYSVNNTAAIWLLGGQPWESFWVNASGTLTVTMATAPAISLAFAVVPAGAGSIQFNYQSYADGGSNTTLARGTYYVNPIPSPGYNFTGWSVSSGLSWDFGFLNVSSTGGTVTAQFALGLFPVTFTTDPSAGPTVLVSTGVGPGRSISNGETTLLSGSSDVLGAVLPAGQTIGGWTASPSVSLGPGPNATVGVHGPATIGLFTSGFALTAGVSPTSAIDLGVSVSFWASAVGSGAFSFLWTGLPTGCTSRNVPAFSCTPTAVGWSNVSVNATAYDGTQHETFVGTVIVVPALLESAFVATPANFTIGGTTGLSVEYVGGAPPVHFQYTGLPPGCASVDARSLVCTPNASGRVDVAVRLWDSGGRTQYGYVELNVNPLPGVTAFMSNPTISEVGLSVALTVVPSGGTAPLTYLYSGLPAGCASADSPALTCSPTAPFASNVTVRVTDADGFTASGAVALQVAAALAAPSVTLSSDRPTVNDTFSIILATSGGVSPYHFAYRGLPAGCLGRDAPQVNCTLIATGNYSMQLTVTDRLGVSTHAFQNLTVAPRPAPPGGGSNGSGSGLSLSGETLAELGGLGAIIVVALVAVLVARRRRPPSGAEPSENPDEGDDLTPGLYQEPAPGLR